MAAGIRLLIIAALTFGGYLMLAGQVSATEAATALILAGLLVAWCFTDAARVRAVAEWGEHLRRWWSAIVHLAPAVLHTGAKLVRAAVRGDVRGRALVIPFVHGPQDDPSDGARRATAVLAASLAPDSFVVRLPPGRDKAVLHAIVAPPELPDPRWLA
ncbi:MAG: hypothetical protein JOY99_10500 [Sphingomonadaceae bacterium]|nr:hypothetical protein [Sphingomonadaceae bacterium]